MVEALAHKSWRFMIYVRLKCMIVDDEYVTIESANINQQTMERTRDTQSAMGAYQPHITWQGNSRIYVARPSPPHELWFSPHPHSTPGNFVSVNLLYITSVNGQTICHLHI